jgi:hypothetical protein
MQDDSTQKLRHKLMVTCRNLKPKLGDMAYAFKLPEIFHQSLDVALGTVD